MFAVTAVAAVTDVRVTVRGNGVLGNTSCRGSAMSFQLNILRKWCFCDDIAYVCVLVWICHPEERPSNNLKSVIFQKTCEIGGQIEGRDGVSVPTEG